MTIRRTSFWVFTGNLLVVAAALSVTYQGGRDPFGERGFVTFVSFFQLLAIAYLSFQILRVKRTLKPPPPRAKRLFWQLLIGGFVFLAADEFLAIHETLDLFIHDIFNLQETPVSDRLDDLIVGLYGVFGAWLLWIHRAEFKTHKQAIAYFKWGFFLLVAMIAIDVLSNDEGFLGRFFSPTMADDVQGYLYQLEDSLKIMAEAFFVMAFHAILRAVKLAQEQLKYARTDPRSGAITPARH